jgi:hypothetical protein
MGDASHAAPRWTGTGTAAPAHPGRTGASRQEPAAAPSGDAASRAARAVQRACRLVMRAKAPAAVALSVDLRS